MQNKYKTYVRLAFKVSIISLVFVVGR
jgi:heme exporter protein D